MMTRRFLLCRLLLKIHSETGFFRFCIQNLTSIWNSLFYYFVIWFKRCTLYLVRMVANVFKVLLLLMLLLLFRLLVIPLLWWTAPEFSWVLPERQQEFTEQIVLVWTSQCETEEPEKADSCLCSIVRRCHWLYMQTVTSPIENDFQFQPNEANSSSIFVPLCWNQRSSVNED